MIMMGESAIQRKRCLVPYWNQISTIMVLYEHKKMLNDCFGNKRLTFHMPRNGDNPVNFDVASGKDGFPVKSGNCGSLTIKY